MTEATRACRRCSADLSHLRRDAVWCEKCPKRIPQKLAERRCETCHEPFQPKRKDAVCCGRSCNMRRLNRKYHQAKGRPGPRTCEPCGEVFTPSRSDQRYCSEACGAKVRYSHKERTTRQIIPCTYCRKPFAPKRMDSTVCSPACSRRVSYAKHRDRRVAAAVAWGKANREARVAISQKYKAMRRQAEQEAAGSVGVSSRDWIKLLRHYRHSCAYCGDTGPIHMEHVIPLSRGGRHAIGNVLPACANCNLSKQADLVAEWKRRKMRDARLAAMAA